MGVKRPLEEESLQEQSFEQHKQLDNNKRLAFVTEDIPSQTAAHEVDSRGEAKSDGVVESNGSCDAVVSKEVEASEEDVGNKNSSSGSNSRGHIDFDMPFRPPQPSDDPYVYLLNVGPRKEIPIGPDHQADIPKWDPSVLNVPPRKEIPIGPDYQAEVPKWDPSVIVKYSSGGDHFDNNDWEQKVLGTCIIPMPCPKESNAYESAVGRGRNSDCSCLDKGSVRCVQQHVMEERGKLHDSLGEEQFAKLGFYEMGEEEISRTWTSKDQELFQEVVFSNPGEDFWKHLTALFPSRTKKELISYYFNVFVVRRRGIQNRSYMSRIDSDHEEDWKETRIDYPLNEPIDDDDDDDVSGDFDNVEEDEGSEVDSICEKEMDAGWIEAEYGFGPKHVGVDDGTVDGDGLDDGTVDGDVLSKDDVDEGGNDNAGAFDGNVGA